MLLFIFLIILCLTLILFYLHFRIENFTPSISNVIENDIATTTLVNNGIGKKAQHLTIYTNEYLSDYFIYVNLLQRNDNKHTIIVLDSQFNIVDEFGNNPGTCIQVYKDYLYVGGPSNLLRYTIDPLTGLVTNKESPDLIIRGFQSTRISDSPIFIINPKTNALYFHLQSPTNSCQMNSQDRKQAPGEIPCTRLRNNSCVWVFDAMKLNQTLDMGILYSIGIRKMRSLVIYNNKLYGITQGRDSLFELYPQYYTKEQGYNLAPDELIKIDQNTNFGFPYCYLDSSISKRVLAPEYGGNGIEQAHCNSLIDKPIEIFNGHNGPNDLLIHNSRLYIAWNGKPFPLKCDKSCATLSVSFLNLDNQTEEMKLLDKGILVQFNSSHKTKPSGLTVCPDNSILITDSLTGKIWKSVLKEK